MGDFMSLYISDFLGLPVDQLSPYYRQIDELEIAAQQQGKMDTKSVADRLAYKINRMNDVIYMFDYCSNNDLQRIKEVFQTRLQEILATA
jgi:hypothetical protein